MSNDICEKFGKRIRQLRFAKGWNQNETAEKIGIDRAYLSLLENGKQEICLRNIELLALGFGIPLAKLFKDL